MRNTTSLKRNVASVSPDIKTFLINKIEIKITRIIKELSFLSKENDEDSRLRQSELTQERDRLSKQLEDLQSQTGNKEASAGDDAITVGDCVMLSNGKRDMEICLVNDYAVDATAGAISTTSPLGKKLLNKKAGEKIEVSTPAGRMEYKILKVK